MMVLTLEMGALLAFLFVDDCRVCAANASKEVECILRKLLSLSRLVSKRSHDRNHMLF